MFFYTTELFPLERKTKDSGGYDLHAIHDYLIEPSECVKISTGIRVSLAPGTVGLVRPRSSWFIKGLVCQGTIDGDYRGECFVLARNVGNQRLTVCAGERIAQLVVTNYDDMSVKKDEPLDVAETRGDNGFGSTGK